MNKRVDEEQTFLGSETIFSAMSELYLLVDLQRCVVHANDAYLAAMNAGKEDIVGRSVFDINQFGSAEQRQSRRNWLEAVLQEAEHAQSSISPPFAYEMPVRSPHGEVALSLRFWVIKASILLLGPASVPHILIRLDEVTERMTQDEQARREKAQLRSQAQLRQIMIRDAEASYRDSQERFKMALEIAELGAWEINPETDAFDCTVQCKLNLGVSPAASINSSQFFHDYIDREDRKRVKDAMDTALAEHLPFECDYRRTWPDGSLHWLLIKGAGRYDDAGRVTSVVGFILDITARKVAEIRQQNIATGEREARERSDSSARAMDHFVSAVSHELRSPLNAILSWSTLLQRAKDLTPMARGAQAIERNARQLTHMVEDLLDSGAIVTGKLSVKQERVDLGSLAGNILEDIRPSAENKGLEIIAAEISPSHVIGDEARLKQVVWNLLTNAVKYTLRGAIELKVRQENGNVVLSIRDTGCGIEPRVLGQIFERFAQVQPENAGRVGGLGLGLWLVKTIIDLHHGQVSVHSDGPNTGATFTVTLPSAGAAH